MGFIVRFDSEGKPYEYPTCRLDTREYAKIIGSSGVMVGEKCHHPQHLC